MQLTDREFWLLLLGIAYGVKFSDAFDRSGADQVIENVAHKVPDVADQARQFAELAMETSPTMADLGEAPSIVFAEPVAGTEGAADRITPQGLRMKDLD
jgi:hypothetical protein